MTWARQDLEGRRGVKKRLTGREFESAVRRCISAYVDLGVTRRDWEGRFPEHVRTEALHTMGPEQLACRG